MGAADVVPGVSGGTIAFITGIYEEFLATISGLKLSLFKTWKQQGFKAMWVEMNGNFLLALFLGIGISIASLAKLLEYLLAYHAILLWSFFFGLILASIWLVGKTVQKWNVQNIIGLMLGAISAYMITVMTPTEGTGNLMYIFICGSIAICAMILPGISGSFILILLGAYTTVLGAVSGALSSLRAGEWTVFTDHAVLLGAFMIGCVFGLIAFSRLLNFLFKKSKNLIIAILTGFLIGSLNKIWPWKLTTLWGTNSHRESIPLVQENLSPAKFAEINHTDSQFAFCLLLMLVGLGLIIVLERFGKKLSQNKTVS